MKIILFIPQSQEYCDSFDFCWYNCATNNLWNLRRRVKLGDRSLVTCIGVSCSKLVKVCDKQFLKDNIAPLELAHEKYYLRENFYLKSCLTNCTNGIVDKLLLELLQDSSRTGSDISAEKIIILSLSILSKY